MTRYAIYAVPGALGSDDAAAACGLRTAAEDWYGRADVADLTASPRRYGFHATLKAPFRLAEGVTEAQLSAAAAEFAARQAPVVIPTLKLASLDQFRALVPGVDHPGLLALAEATVRDFEPYRAPLTAEEVARRRPEQLTAAQRDLLTTWGYPYVLDEFRFHLTLTESVADERAAVVDAALAQHFAAVLGHDVPVRSITVFAEPAPGSPFVVVSVHPLEVG